VKISVTQINICLDAGETPTLVCRVVAKDAGKKYLIVDISARSR
jgi:hypothetical protein